MNNGLSKKEKKEISRALTKKLQAMGVTDEITYVPSGKKIKRPVLENNTFKIEDGKIVMEELDVPLAMNALRRTVRNLRNAPIEQINAFLSMPTPSAQPATETPSEAVESGT